MKKAYSRSGAKEPRDGGVQKVIPDFRGKWISFVQVGDAGSKVLYDVALQEIAGRLCFVGTIPDGDSRQNWMTSLTAVLPWDQVQEYVIFESAADFEERSALLNPKRKLVKLKKKGK